MVTLKINSKGPDVKKWQLFLIGQGILKGLADGIFGSITDAATKAFQKKYELVADGIVGQLTYAKAMEFGLPIVEEPKTTSQKDPYWMPPEPDFLPLVSNQSRQNIFGKYSYKINNEVGDIIITDNWQKENIIGVELPQLIGVQGAPKTGIVSFHKLAAKQLKDLFNAWEKEGLIKLILGWGGSFNPRMVRGSSTVLSNHAFGTAFDINVPWNWIGAIPARIDQEGSVRELVPLSNKFGFYWGGHYNKRKDGMHFEVAKLINS